MSDLQRFHAKICLTATAWLLHQEKILLIHHKKLGIWLAPGGHVDDHELPHQAAEREFWEETGMRVKAIPERTFTEAQESEYVPNPFASNIHWVCKENYWLRQGIGKAESVPEGWRKRNCEQHLALLYFVYPTSGVEFRQNHQETLGIEWFSEAQIDDLHTTNDVKAEAKFVFREYPR